MRFRWEDVEPLEPDHPLLKPENKDKTLRELRDSGQLPAYSGGASQLSDSIATSQSGDPLKSKEETPL